VATPQDLEKAQREIGDFKEEELSVIFKKLEW
jgi:hypothetical protein